MILNLVLFPFGFIRHNIHLQLEEDKQKHARQAYQLHKSLRPISGSSVDNNEVIENIDQIRLLAMKVIQEALGLL